MRPAQTVPGGLHAPRVFETPDLDSLELEMDLRKQSTTMKDWQTQNRRKIF